jgi:hypothetical protein
MIDLKQFEGHTPGPWERVLGSLSVDNGQLHKMSHTDYQLIMKVPDLLDEVKRLREALEEIKDNRDCSAGYIVADRLRAIANDALRARKPKEAEA